MFSKAIASVKNRQFGFQVLTSLAVIGASYLQAWEEALLVLILVSWTEHMENEALVKAREAMQGGQTAYLVLQEESRRRASEVSQSLRWRLYHLPNFMAPIAKNTDAVEEIPIGLVMRGDHLEIREW